MKRNGRLILILFFLPLLIGNGSAQESLTQGIASSNHRIRSSKITLLSTMLATMGIGEWGFAALVQVDGHEILFDAGRLPDTVLKNAESLKIDLSHVTDVILSHHHGDHTGGLLTLRRELSKMNPEAMSRAHVASGFFAIRREGIGEEDPSMASWRAEYEATGGLFVEHEKPTELFPGVWLTGSVPRIHPERNWSGSRQIKTNSGWVEDTIVESQSLVLDTERGLVVLSGCGHAGIINTMEFARKSIREAPIHAALGGFHLLAADDKHLNWTAGKLRSFGLEYFLGAHCTGIEAVYQIREKASLTRPTCVVGAVGAFFSLEHGLEPLYLAR